MPPFVRALARAIGGLPQAGIRRWSAAECTRFP